MILRFLKNICSLEGSPRWCHRRSWTNFLPWTHDLQLQMEKFPLKETWKLTEQLLQNNEKVTQRWILESEICCYQNLSPSTVSHKQEGSHTARAPREGKNWCSTAGTITLGTCTRETRPLKHPALKNKAYVQEIQKAVGNGDPTLNAPLNWLNSRPSTKAV